nr:RNA polymerase [Bovine narmovirus 1]
MDSVGISDLLYPECHLDSPIVINKLIMALEYSQIQHSQPLNDKTILNNIRFRIRSGFTSPYINTQRVYSTVLNSISPRYTKFGHIPYPECNSYLFGIYDSTFSSKLYNVLQTANNRYKKISVCLSAVLRSTYQDLGLRIDRLPSETRETIKNVENLDSFMVSSTWYLPFLFWFTLKTEMRAYIKTNSKQTRERGMAPLVIRSTECIIVANQHIITIMSLRRRLRFHLTYEMVLMYSDVVEGRLMIDTAMASDVRLRPLKVRFYRMWEIIDALFEDLGNANYDLVSLLEPLTLAVLQLRDEAPILAGAFLNHVITQIREIFRSNGYTVEEELGITVHQIIEILNIDDINLIAEFFSLFRTFGHPCLEAAYAAGKVREFMNLPKLICFKTMMKAHAIFCGMIINGYRDRHGGAWPPFTFPEHSSKKLVQLQRNGEALTTEVCVNHWQSFCGAHFDCFMDLTLDDDLTIYMRDKALASIYKEWDTIYKPDILRYTPPPQSTSRRLIQVFLEDHQFDPYYLLHYVLNGDYLNDQSFNISYSLKEKETKQAGRLFAKMTYKMRACQVIAESLLANGVCKFFHDNGMVKNEHDLLKTLYRLSASSVSRNKKFMMQPQRTPNRDIKRSVSTPATMQSRGPQESVTSVHHSTRYQSRDNQENRPKTNWQTNWNRRRSKSYNGGTSSIRDGSIDMYETMSAFLTADLQKFCLNWRFETVGVFAERLNEIYGLPDFFQWLHKRLEKSVLYVSDPSCPPDLDESVPLHDLPNNHLYIKWPMGGIEGFCQKMWTIIMIPYLYLAAHETGIRIASIVQGDNQAIAITRLVHSNLPYTIKKNMCAETAKQYFLKLREILGLVGHNLKANETIISSHFFVYSKRIYYDGLVLSQALKSVSRCVFWSETIVDETRSACSNISTSLAKSIEQGLAREIGYGLNFLKTLQQLYISLQFTINETVTQDVVSPLISSPNWLIIAASVGAPLGGFNYMNLSRLFVRNIGDPVTASLADLKRMINSGLLSLSILKRIMNQTPGKSSYLDWANDPYSINIPDTQSITKLIKNITARLILSNSPNPMLKGLFHMDCYQEDHDLAAFLLDRPIIIPRAAHEIINNSITGARESIAGMLDTTKGLIRTGLMKGGLRPALVLKISNFDYNQFRRFNEMMMAPELELIVNTNVCAVELAKSLRRRMWQSLTRGRPIYGLEVPDIIESSLGYILQGHTECQLCEIGNSEYGWFFVPHGCELDQVTSPTNALRVPYVGSSTDERSDIRLGHVKHVSKALKSAIRIAMVYTWAYGDSEEAWIEAWYLACQRASLSIEELKLITPVSTSNNLSHRLRDRSTQMKYSGSTLHRVSRYTAISNDNLNFTIDGLKTDTNFIYQQSMLLGLSILEQLFRFKITTGSQNTVLHLHVRRECCVIQMQDHPYVSTSLEVPTYRPIENNKLIFDECPIIEKDAIILSQQRYRKQLVDFTTWSTTTLEQALSQSLAHTIVEIMTKLGRDHINEMKVFDSDDDINSLITEFLLVEPLSFSIYLGQCVSVSWAYDLHFRRPLGKHQMTDCLCGLLFRSPRVMFTVLANALSHPRVFDKFWSVGLIEPVHGPILYQQDFISIAQELVVQSYKLYIDLWLANGDKDLHYIMCETDEDIVEQRFEIVQSKHLCFLIDLYSHTSKSPDIRGLTALEKCAILSAYLSDQALRTPGGYDWNTSTLDVDVFPCSLTYLRRGVIKQLRLRKYPEMQILAQPLREGLSPAVVDPKDKHCTITSSDMCWDSDDLGKLLSQIVGSTITSPTKHDVHKRWDIHLFRRVGINSTSCYKALEIVTFIIGKFPMDLPRVYLGEGSGSMMAVYQGALGATLCYYNTGASYQNTPGQRELRLDPSEYCLVESNNTMQSKSLGEVRVLFNGRPETTWIGNYESYSYILNTVPLNSVGFIHCDLETTHKKDPLLMLEEYIHALCIAYALGNSESIFIIKLAPIRFDHSSIYLNTLLRFYNKCYVFYPSYSNMYSTEIYVISMYPKCSKVLNPDELLSTILKEPYTDPNTLIDYVLGKKHAVNLRMREKYTTWGNLQRSRLTGLTEDEKMLLRLGFKINGPYLINKMFHFDVASDITNLQNIIISLYKDIIYRIESPETSHALFQPYPVFESSKLREIIFDICGKTILYNLLYDHHNTQSHIGSLTNNLKQGLIYIQIPTPDEDSFIPKIIRTKIIKYKLKRVWVFDLDVASIKRWWKILGYVLLLRGS